MRRVRFSAAISLDGYIAGPNGEIDWIIMDPDIDFSTFMAAFDTVVMGRKSYEAARQQDGGMPGMETYVISRTLRQEDCPGVTVSDKPAETLAALKAAPGKDIWLFGGGVLLRDLLDLGLVDVVERGRPGSSCSIIGSTRRQASCTSSTKPHSLRRTAGCVRTASKNPSPPPPRQAL